MKALDLNKAKRLSFPVTMMDDAQTVFNLTIPTVDVIKELKGIGTELTSATTGDQDAVDSCFEVAAKLFSCNRLRKPVTVEQLKVDYKMELEDLILFFGAYLEFITELTKAKN